MRRRSAHDDLADAAEARQISASQATPAQRHRARLQVMHAGHDLTERQELLAALGLDGHDTIRADRNHRQGDPT